MRRSRFSVVLDLDGTLVDSEGLLASGLPEFLRQYGVEAAVEDIADLIHGGCFDRNSENLQNFCLEKADDPSKIPDLETFRTAYAAFAKDVYADVQAISGAAAFLKGLSEAGIPFSVATNGRRESALAKIRSAGLDVFIKPDQVFTRDNVGHAKPAPDVVRKAAIEKDYDPHWIIGVEDSPTGIQAVRAAGGIAVGILAGAHCAPEDEQSLRDAGAHYVVHSFGEMLAVVKQLNDMPLPSVWPLDQIENAATVRPSSPPSVS